jgi:RNA 3'-terminal phosphate cyclase (ATP)
VTLLTLDGSTGEGGGQVLRTALSLSVLLTRPVQLVNIRAGRHRPGLRPQHVQSIKAAAAICSAQVTGATEHSTTLRFEPGTPPRAGTYRFDIGTAGSASLVLQSILVPLSYASGPSQVVVTGGTHVAWSPAFDYLQQVYLPGLEPLGFQASAQLQRWGFYPQGGGQVMLSVAPHQALSSPMPGWTQPRQQLRSLHILSAAANVGNQVTARQASQAYNRLLDAGFASNLLHTRLLNPQSSGPGTCLFLLATYGPGQQAGFTGYGRRGYPAERVADDAVDAFLHHQRSDAPVDPHLADQLLLPLVASGHDLAFVTSEVTPHLLTNAWVIAQFLGPCVLVEGQPGAPGTVRIQPSPGLASRPDGKSITTPTPM